MFHQFARYLFLGGLVWVVGLSLDDAQAQQDYGRQLVQLLEDQATAEKTVAKVEADCAGAWENVRQYIGPIHNPMEPRDLTCQAFVEPSGRRLDGFAACSAAYFVAYDKAHTAYRQCFDAQNIAATTLIDTHKKRLTVDQQARAAARAVGNAPAGPNGQRGWLGIRYAGISNKTMQKFGLTSRRGVRINRVSDNSPAAKAGLQVDDVILAMDGDHLEDRKSFAAQTKNIEAGRIVVFDLIRAGQRRFAYIAVEER